MSVFALLVKVLRSDDPHVACIGAAAVWTLAQEENTLKRLPVGKLVTALLHTYPIAVHADVQEEDAEGEGEAAAGEEGEAGGEGGEGGEGAAAAEAPADLLPLPPSSPFSALRAAASRACICPL